MTRDESRSRIADIVNGLVVDAIDVNEMCNRIHDLFSGPTSRLVVSEQCGYCGGDGLIRLTFAVDPDTGKPYTACVRCLGKGVVTRPATVEEIVEVAEHYLEKYWYFPVKSGKNVRLLRE
jgi:hypothetical protein